MNKFKAHILVVDDDDGIRNLVKKFLNKNKYLVTTASNALEAENKLKLIKFDLIVLDIMMPEKTGLEFIDENKFKLKTPIILLTAKGDISDRIEGLETGADDYLPKPFEPKELELRINRQCDNTKRIVKFLDESKFVDSICYPFHQAFPQLKLAKKQMKKGGTIVSFRLKSQKNEKKKIAFNFLNNLSLIDISNNLGDSKSLITHPDTTTHSKLSSKEKNELGISQNLVRLSVGLEDVEDIIEDIETSFKKSYI